MATILLARLESWIKPRWAPLRQALLSILKDHRAKGTLSLALVDDALIRDIHRKFLNEDRPTDVLSFLLEPISVGHRPAGSERVFGEVVVSAETAMREAKKRGLPPEEELALYAIHGTLHLVGFDDQDPKCRRKMRRAEQQYLARYRAFSALPRSTRPPGRRRHHRTQELGQA